MLAIRVFSVLDSAVIQVDLIARNTLGAPPQEAPQVLTHFHCSVDQVTDVDGLARMLHRALRQAEGDARDLYEHVTG